MYSFDTQLAKGQKYDRLLDRRFADKFEIRPASRREERLGIDRHFTDRVSGQRFAVQYKADKTAARTGNAFVETISVDTTDTPGWARSCSADFIVYYIVGLGPAYIVRPDAIRQQLGRWSQIYPQRRIPNKGYHTVGIIVPLDEFERIAFATVDV